MLTHRHHTMQPHTDLEAAKIEKKKKCFSLQAKSQGKAVLGTCLNVLTSWNRVLKRTWSYRLQVIHRNTQEPTGLTDCLGEPCNQGHSECGINNLKVIDVQDYCLLLSLNEQAGDCWEITILFCSLFSWCLKQVRPLPGVTTTSSSMFSKHGVLTQHSTSLRSVST